jgi:ankyrin repeat protein
MGVMPKQKKRNGPLDQQYLNAIRLGDHKYAGLCLLSGASLNARDHEGNTALHIAARNGDMKGMKWFLQKLYRKIDPRNGYNETPLLYLLRCGAKMKRRFPREMVRLLLQYGASVEVCDSFGRNPTHFAVQVGDPEIIDWLLWQGDTNHCDEDGYTPFCRAVLTENIMLIRPFKNRKVDPDHKETDVFPSARDLLKKSQHADIRQLYS